MDEVEVDREAVQRREARFAVGADRLRAAVRDPRAAGPAHAALRHDPRARSPHRSGGGRARAAARCPPYAGTRAVSKTVMPASAAAAIVSSASSSSRSSSVDSRMQPRPTRSSEAESQRVSLMLLASHGEQLGQKGGRVSGRFVAERVPVGAGIAANDDQARGAELGQVVMRRRLRQPRQVCELAQRRLAGGEPAKDLDAPLVGERAAQQQRPLRARPVPPRVAPRPGSRRSWRLDAGRAAATGGRRAAVRGRPGTPPARARRRTHARRRRSARRSSPVPRARASSRRRPGEQRRPRPREPRRPRRRSAAAPRRGGASSAPRSAAAAARAIAARGRRSSDRARAGPRSPSRLLPLPVRASRLRRRCATTARRARRHAGGAAGSVPATRSTNAATVPTGDSSARPSRWSHTSPASRPTRSSARLSPDEHAARSSGSQLGRSGARVRSSASTGRSGARRRDPRAARQ